MKRLGQVLGSLLALALALASFSAVAETKLGGRDFNHMATGFPLLGVHATAACETCHVGGVFKGTPRACDGCHALGKRIVATPKSTSHIVTDAPCETCHFNTSTFFGARYNHGTAVPGQCTTCHNGRIAKDKHAAHIVTTKSCDNCHRTSAFIPASWNHTGAQYSGQACGTCHNGVTARTYTNAAYHNVYIANGITQCNSCHTNYTSFYSHRYDHAGVVVACVTCHTAANSPAIKAMAANHIPIALSATCNACHTSTASWASVSMQHNPTQIALTPCTTCHLSSAPYVGRMTKKNYGHEGFRAGQDCISCHTQQYSRWNKP